MRKFFSAAGRSGLVRAFRHRDFSWYIVAHAGSVIGLWIQRIAIQWLVWTLSGSYAWLGAFAAAEAVTAMTFSLMAGPFADRFDRVRMAFITQGLLMVVAVALAVTTYLGLISLPVLFIFVALTGVIEGVWAPVRLALMPNMVPREDMAAAVAITSMMFTAAIFVGPAIGGLIIAAIGVEGAFAANAVSYVGLLLVFSRIQIKGQAPRKSGAPGSFMTDFSAGIAHVVHSPALRAIVLFGFTFSILVRPYRELFAGVADDIFGRGAEGLAVLASAAGLGALVGALGIAIYGRTRALTRVLVICAVASVVLLLVFAWSRSFTVSIVAAAALSLCVTVFGTGAQMMIQMSVADTMRGRVMSVWQSQFRGIPAVGAWIMGLLEPRLGLSMVLAGAGGLFALYLLLALPSSKGLQQLEQAEGEPVNPKEGN
ncbi:MFS transporter [Gilvimarinus sp. F26214L]|uniref:MFS transporter n=1 Tax=Gilvimarinus sp. DZF01 TaxID=3461371 RepID=UPI00404678AB